MFKSDNEIHSELHEEMRKYASDMLNADPITFVRTSFCMAGTVANYIKSLRQTMEDAISCPIFSSLTLGAFAPDCEKYNTFYHLIHRAMMIDEIVYCASYLPRMPKEFIEKLQSIDSYLERSMYNVLHADMNVDPEHGQMNISGPFVQSLMTSCIRACKDIMANAVHHLEDPDANVAFMANQTMIACCKYLDRIGIQPNTMEGLPERGDVWYDLKTYRSRVVVATLTWWDHFSKMNITTTIGFVEPAERRDRNS